MTRRLFLGAAASPLVLTAAYGRWEAQSLQIEFTRLPRRPETPADLPWVRLLHISDVHSSFLVPDSLIDHAIETAASLRPDLVCATGDFISFGAAPVHDRFRSQLRALAGIAPAYAVLGNHDGGIWAGKKHGAADSRFMRDELANCGFRVLHNESEIASVDARRLRLVGVGDRWSQEIDPERAFDGVEPAEEILLLAHNPDSKTEVSAYPWRLMLSGHTHGGQLRVPFHGATPFAPVADHRYVDGLRAWEGRWIQVSRGVGNVKGLRFNCPPEINLIEI